MNYCYSTVLGVVLGLIVIGGCSRKSDTPQAASNAPAGSHTTSEAHDTVWMTDFEAAKAKAAEEGKDLLVDFSGSDWCYWCKRLSSEVFSKQGFIDSAGEHFVFVKIDFPSDKSKQSSELRAQNERLQRRFRIQGFPTVILMTSDAQPYAETGYREGGPDAYLTHLEQLRTQK